MEETCGLETNDTNIVAARAIRKNGSDLRFPEHFAIAARITAITRIFLIHHSGMIIAHVL
jgi:phosphate starvation-inducible membrane PsiE